MDINIISETKNHLYLVATEDVHILKINTLKDSDLTSITICDSKKGEHSTVIKNTDFNILFKKVSDFIIKNNK